VTPPDIPDFVGSAQTPMPTAAAIAAAAVSARITAPAYTVS